MISKFVKVVVISGSPRKIGNTLIAMKKVYEYTCTKNQDTELIDLSDDKVECYRGPEKEYNQTTKAAAESLMAADVWLIGTPIYNSFFSSTLKNLFEYINYKKTEGKVAGMAIMAAGNIGFVDVQTILTQLLSYFRVIANPKAVYLTTESITKDFRLDEDSEKRLTTMVDETLDMAKKLSIQN